MMHNRKHLIAEGATAFSKEAVEAFLMKVDSLLDSGYKEYIADLGIIMKVMKMLFSTESENIRATTLTGLRISPFRQQTT